MSPECVPSVAETAPDFKFQVDAVPAAAFTCKSYVTWSPFVVLLIVTELSLEVTTVRAAFN